MTYPAEIDKCPFCGAGVHKGLVGQWLCGSHRLANRDGHYRSTRCKLKENEHLTSQLAASWRRLR